MNNRNADLMLAMGIVAASSPWHVGGDIMLRTIEIHINKPHPDTQAEILTAAEAKRQRRMARNLKLRGDV